MEEKKIKNKNLFSLPSKTIFIVTLFLLIGLFFAGHSILAQIPTAQQTAGLPNVTGGQTASGGTGSTAATAAKADGTCGILDFSCQIPMILTSIERLILNVSGDILALLMPALIFVAEYNAFTTSPPVTDGWVIVRDLCNMFFILILLLIAFATILRVEGYDIKKMVPKLVIMAILINFSKTICGLIIDFAQVIMNTFISPFAGIGAISMTTMLGLNTMSGFSSSGVAATQWSIFAAYAFALIYTLIAAVVLVVIFVVLVVRIVMLWIYIVLSPLSYLLATFPQGQRYVSQWWEEFTKNVIVGPVLAFFLWLSFVSLGTTNSGTSLLGNGAPTDNLIKDMPPVLTGAMTLDQLIKFTVSIGMLVGGLIVTQQMGGYMGKIAGQGMAKIQGGAKILGGGVKRIATAPLGAAKWAGGVGVDALQHRGIVDLNVGRVWKGFQERRQEKKASLYNLGQKKASERLQQTGRFGGALALTAMPRDAYNQLNSREGLTERFWRGGKGTAKLRGEAGDQLKVEEDKLGVAQGIKDINSRTDISLAKQQEANYKAGVAGTDHSARKNAIKTTEADILSDRNNIRVGEANGTLKGPVLDQAKINLAGKEKELSWIKEVDQDIGNEKKGNKLDVDQKKQNYAQAPQQLINERNEDQAKRLKLVSQLSPDDWNAFKNSETGTEPFEDRVKAAKDEQGKYAPVYNAEARAAGQQAEAVEGAKTKDITDSDEKLRMLISAIKNKNQPAIRAILKQMAMNGDDNEALQPLVGDTSAFGIQKLMSALSGKLTAQELASNPQLKDLNAGFSEQDAMALGSEIGMINKQTNHWNATAPYKMRGGVWEKSTEKDMSDFRSAEISKMDPQVITRAFNRLAYGREDSKRKFHLDAAGVISLRLLDNANGINQIGSRMTQNTAEKLTKGDAGEKLRDLVKNGILSQQIVDVLFQRAKSSAKNPTADLQQIHDVLGE